MKYLIYLGTELNVNNEIELFTENKLGFDAVIIYNNGSVETRHNLTEVHHLYKTPFEPSIAFESDIHSTGGTVKVEDIDSVVIVLSAVKHENY
jgi:hypothetical protein